MGQRPYRLMRTCWGNRVEIPDKGHYCNAQAKPEYPARLLEWQTVNPGRALYSMRWLPSGSGGMASVPYVDSVSMTIRFGGHALSKRKRAVGNC